MSEKSEKRNPTMNPMVGDAWHEGWSVWHVIVTEKDKDTFIINDSYGGGSDYEAKKDEIGNELNGMIYFGNLVDLNEAAKECDDSDDIKYHHTVLYKRFFEDLDPTLVL